MLFEQILLRPFNAVTLACLNLQAFRHFDTDGNGSISQAELEAGLDDLGIFDNIPNWRAQLPQMVKKFDSSGDGSVQLKVRCDVVRGSWTNKC